ncbi:MAG: glutamate/gamma-aminobutyrate family transporter YjeM [Sarcina sp.]
MIENGTNKIEKLEEGAAPLKDALKKKNYKVGFWSFVAMIFMTCYGLSNGQQIYYQMGYAAITYIVIGVIFFFIPYTFMVSEMSSAFSKEKGGIFSWMRESVGLKFSTTGAFIWYISAVIWWFSTSSIAITLSTMIFGKDVSETWHIFGLSNTGTTAIIGIIWFMIIVFFCRKGVKSISLLANISMLITIVMHIVILGGGLLVFFLDGFHFLQPFHYTGISSLFMGPNKSYDNTWAALAFLVFAIFTLGGMEASGGLIDKVKNPKKNVPKAMIASGIIIAVLYVAIIIISGMSINWHKAFGDPNVNLFNYPIYMVQQQFYALGIHLGMSNSASISFGLWINRITTWFSFIAMLNLPLMLYYPIKQMFEGLPDGMLPKVITKKNKHGFTANALYIQAAIIVLAMIAIGFGGNTANTVYNNLTFMVTITTSIPWIFIVFAYIKFKLNDNIKKEYEFFNKKWGVIVGIITLIVLLFANILSIIQPFAQHNYNQGLWIVTGPIIFGAVGYFLAFRYIRKQKKAKKII